jgi:arylsulfatase A-like enzyme
MSYMPRRLLFAVLASILCLGAASTMQAQAAPDSRGDHPSRPNIVIVMADDLGNADLGYRGSDIRTPNIDQLAHDGVRLEAFYGMKACTMSRAALLTGRHAFRYGLEKRVIYFEDRNGLPTAERTLPQALKDVGYRTAMVGKWHLGHADPKYWPQNRGFDYFYGTVGGRVDYFSKKVDGVLDWQRNGVFVNEKGYHTRLIGDEAVKIIEHHDTSKPLFLYVAAQAPHVPYEAPAEAIEAYNDLPGNKDRRIYAAMITELDTQVGKIMAALARKGIADNTLVIFTSDNGGDTRPLREADLRSQAELDDRRSNNLVRTRPASNGVFRGGKMSLYEGGVRVPAIFYWPAHLKPRIVEDPVGVVDVMPTLLALAGGVGDPRHPFDGKDAWPAIADGKRSPHRYLLINIEPSRGAIRKGKWKLLANPSGPKKAELFDLAVDPGEQKNVAHRFPGIVRDLEARLGAYANDQKLSGSKNSASRRPG